MTETSFMCKNSANSEDGSVSSNINKSYSSQQANRMVAENTIPNNNTNEHFEISRSAVTTPGSEIELNLQNFTLKEQDLLNPYTANNSNFNSRMSVNNINSKFNSASAGNFASALDSVNGNQLSNVMGRFSLSAPTTQSPNKSLSSSNEVFYKNLPQSAGDYVAASPISSLYVLKIQNVPSDLTARESHILFALMNDCTPRSIEILQDGSEKFIKATIPDLKIAIDTAITLDSKKNLFGPYFPFKSFIQLFDNQNMQQIPFNDPSFNVKTGELVSNSSSANRLGFVDPFNGGNSQIDDNKITGANGGNIWFDNNTNGVAPRDSTTYLRPSLLEKQLDYRNQSHNDYPNYNTNVLNTNGARQGSNISLNIYTPPASGASNASPIFENGLNAAANNINSSSTHSAGDLSNLRKASLAMTTTSYGTDPRMSISAGSIDGTISRLQSYIVNSKYLRNLPMIFASIPGITEEDLDSLGKVPPPANPADQNPPCNTLYVGNLPPETTEQDMRIMFQSQSGFSRLSFRNKPNNNNNNHGPMCFVEFEHIIYATRALSSLYGAQIPSRNVSQLSHSSDGSVNNVNKLMGIRLSFSKNPLGVRNTQTTMAHLQQQALNNINNNYNNNFINHSNGNNNSSSSNNYQQNSMGMSARRSVASSVNGAPTVSSLQSGEMQMKSYPSSAQSNIGSQNKFSPYR